MEGKGGAPCKTLSFVKFDSEDEYSSDDDLEYSSDVDMAALDMGSETALATHILSQEKFEEEIALMQKRVELYRNQNIEFDKEIACKVEELARTKEELAKIKEEHAKVKEQHTTMKELLLKRQNARVAVQSSGKEVAKLEEQHLAAVDIHLSEDQINLLEVPFTESEVRGAVFQMKKIKAPGPDGFVAGLVLRRFNMVLAFLHSGVMLRELNESGGCGHLAYCVGWKS